MGVLRTFHSVRWRCWPSVKYTLKDNGILYQFANLYERKRMNAPRFPKVAQECARVYTVSETKITPRTLKSSDRAVVR